MSGLNMSFVIIMATLLCAGCDSTYTTEVDGLPYGGVDEVCIDGVVYYAGFKRLAVGFNVDSTVKTCDE